MKRLLSILSLLSLLSPLSPLGAWGTTKREFRAAWIQAVNHQFEAIGRDSMQRVLTYQLDELQRDGCNAIIFQVRPECDALYESRMEPWSRFLTGRQGRAPEPLWDPLEWMIQECHRRDMELHAWINPFRAKTKVTGELADSSWVKLHPEAWFEYDGLYILNPALEENTQYTCKVVRDILQRYDVDGLHIDDYFYPYPAAGIQIPDRKFYEADPRGFGDIGDWRRDNVSRFVETLSKTIKEVKPWVKFGISPFGIYRNRKSDPVNGSDTNGLENYDNLYADILLWVNNGWCDYCVPQLYWEIGNRNADYETLIKWWNRFSGKRPLYIGEDIERTVKYADLQNPRTNQMGTKYRLHQELPNVRGTVLWYARTAVDNIGNYGTMLRQNYWRYPALQPEMTFISEVCPKKPHHLETHWTEDGFLLTWRAPKSKDWQTYAWQYVVYRFRKGETVDFTDASHIVTVTHQRSVLLPYAGGKEHYVYYVTALNRLHNESLAAKKKIKL